MQLILEFSDGDLNAPDSPEADIPNRSGYAQRQAARAVLTDGDGRVALLHVNKYGYYKLPGGGIDKGEGVTEALKRELLEEIGCHAEVTGELGQTVEYRDQQRFKQTSHCFTAVKVGEQQAPELTDKELNDGFEMVWAADLDDAIALVSEARPELYEAHHIQMRDAAILRAAKSNS